MKLSDKKAVVEIVTALFGLGLREVVICPGSRNAPLILTFNRYNGFHCTSIRDERSAAFFALGKSIALKEPVAVVSTSGSATLNFAPAISEAYYQRMPLIVITADRPQAWTGQGDGQTINQENVYKNFIRKSFELNGDAVSEEALWYNSRMISEGFEAAKNTDPGPVHFNIPLSEPLYNVSEEPLSTPKIFKSIHLEKKVSSADIHSLAYTFSRTKKVMILVGQHPKDNALEAAMRNVSAFLNTIVLRESTSNIYSPDFIENIDRCITTMTPEQMNEFSPDLLITVGGAVVSKRIKAMIRNNRPKQHWNVDSFDSMMDTYKSLTLSISTSGSDFFQQLSAALSKGNIESDYRQKWLERKNQLEKIQEEFSAGCRYSDYFVFNEIFKLLPTNVHLYLSNSSPIRYAQLFDDKPMAFCWSNRGTSGIDGCTSTTFGAASVAPDDTFVLITGDVAFYYDINAFWNNEKIENVNIILINNGGGGIFRIISGKEAEPEMEQFFETAQEKSAEKIAGFYNWNYLSAYDQESLSHSLKKFFNVETKKTILEIFTPAKLNPEVLSQYWNYLKENFHEDNKI